MADGRRAGGKDTVRVMLYVALAVALGVWAVCMGDSRTPTMSWVSGITAGIVLVGLGASRKQGWGNSAGWGMSTSRAILYVILMTVGIVVTVLGITFAEISVESSPHPSSDYLVATFILVALVAPAMTQTVCETSDNAAVGTLLTPDLLGCVPSAPYALLLTHLNRPRTRPEHAQTPHP